MAARRAHLWHGGSESGLGIQTPANNLAVAPSLQGTATHLARPVLVNLVDVCSVAAQHPHEGLHGAPSLWVRGRARAKGPELLSRGPCLVAYRVMSQEECLLSPRRTLREMWEPTPQIRISQSNRGCHKYNCCIAGGAKAATWSGQTSLTDRTLRPHSYRPRAI